MNTRSPLYVSALAVTLLCWPTHIEAQFDGFGGAIGGTLMVGESSDLLDGGLTLVAFVAKRPTPMLRVRLDAAYTDLADHTVGAETADNRILFLGLGPEISSPGPLSVYARASVGFAVNFQSRSTGSNTSSENPAAFGWTLAGGLRFGVFDLGGALTRLGDLEFARASGESRVSTARTSLLTIQVGVTL